MIPDQYFDSFATQKYRHPNPVQRLLIRRFVQRLSGLFDSVLPATSVLELGCGEGFVSGCLSKRTNAQYVGVDMSAEDLRNLEAKFPAIETHEGSVYDLSFLDRKFDVVVCAEVLEHLDTPEVALDQILSVRPRAVVLSVPHEPWFCLSNLARGKNVTRLGNDDDHVNLWGKRGFLKLLRDRLEVERYDTSYPWQMVLARPND